MNKSCSDITRKLATAAALLPFALNAWAEDAGLDGNGSARE